RGDPVRAPPAALEGAQDRGRPRPAARPAAGDVTEPPTLTPRRWPDARADQPPCPSFAPDRPARRRPRPIALRQPRPARRACAGADPSLRAGRRADRAPLL